MTDQRATPHSDTDLYKRLVDSVRDYAIVALNAAGNITTWNSGAEKFTQYAADEIVGRHASVLFTPEDIASNKPRLLLEAASRGGRVEDESWLLRKDGSSFCAHIVLTKLLDAAGAFVGYTAVARDLTHRRLADDALIESDQRFRLIVQSIRDYA